MQTKPLVISKSDFLATGASVAAWNELERFDGNPRDGKLDVDTYAARVKKEIACHGLGADRTLNGGVQGLRYAAYAAKMKGLATAPLFAAAEAAVETARSEGFAKYPSCD